MIKGALSPFQYKMVYKTIGSIGEGTYSLSIQMGRGRTH